MDIFMDDYVDDILAKVFADENGVEIILDDILHIDELDDVEPTDDELDAIESELGKASV